MPALTMRQRAVTLLENATKIQGCTHQMRLTVRIFSRCIATMAVMMALVASGVAHKTFSAGPSPELASYIAAGGSLGDLCGSLGDPGKPRGAKCEACRLMGAALLPPVADWVSLDIPLQTRKLFIVAERLNRTRPLDPARLTRAPPQA